MFRQDLLRSFIRNLLLIEICVATALTGLCACTPNNASEFASDGNYDIDADPVVREMNEAERNPEVAAEFKRRVEGVLAKPALTTIMAFRSYPGGAEIFTDAFLSQHGKFLQSVSLAELFNIKSKQIRYSNEGKAEFVRLAAHFASTSRARSSRANLQLLDESNSGSKCQSVYNDWENDNGISTSLKLLSTDCNFWCKYTASASAGLPMGYTTGGPTAGGALKASAIFPKYLALLKLNHCGNSDPNCFDTSRGQLGGVTAGDCKGEVAEPKNKRICERFGALANNPYHSVDSQDRSLYCRCENDNCSPGI